MSNEGWKGFLFGGLSGMGATMVVQPIDLIKNRMQLSGEGGAAKAYSNSFQAALKIIQQEGFFNMYNGLSAGLLRQATYTTTRLGVYTKCLDVLKERNKGKTPSFLEKLFAGCFAGGVGAIVGTPAEVALIRMTSDGRLPPEKRRNYKNAFDAISRIVREESVGTLWKGCAPTVARAMALNTAQLGTYSQAKEMISKYLGLSDGTLLHFCSSMVSGLIATAVSMPIDITKTRIQTMTTTNGKPQYTGALDCLTKTVKAEGVLSLWKGFTPYYLRLGPHTVLTFIFLEQFNKYFTSGSKL